MPVTSLGWILIALALVCFFLAAVNVVTTRVNLIALGLFFTTLAMLLRGV